MPIRDPELTRSWMNANPKVNRSRIYAWTDLADRTDYAFELEFDYEDWLTKTDRSTPPPDLVEWMSWYGYLRLRMRDWKLPIDLPESEFPRWRKAGYFVTREDFYDEIAKVASGFLFVAGIDPELTVQIIAEQLEKKFEELERLADLPIAEYYTPFFREEDYRKRRMKQGFTGSDLKRAVEEDLLEDRDLFQAREFEKPFALRQELESFEWAMEKYRLISVGDNNPKIGLPNWDLYEALREINLNKLLARLGQIDVKLRAIWRNLAKHGCYDLNADFDPEGFWWRHWKKPEPRQPRQQPQQQRKPYHGKRRGNSGNRNPQSS